MLSMSKLDVFAHQSTSVSLFMYVLCETAL